MNGTTILVALIKTILIMVVTVIVSVGCWSFLLIGLIWPVPTTVVTFAVTFTLVLFYERGRGCERSFHK